MSKKTKIEWTEATRNPMSGCTNKSLIDGYIDGVECRAMPEVLK